MSVVRGDAARRLMARAKTVQAHQPAPPPGHVWSASMALAHGVGASEAACEFVALELAAHDLGERVADATPAVHELVTNARAHGRGQVTITVSLTTEGLLLLEVSDEGPVQPKLTDATRLGSVGGAAAAKRGDPDRPGAGLKLVSLLSQDWGIWEHAAGKTVWALLHEHDVRCRGCHLL